MKVDLINSDTYKDLERERVVDVNINRLRKKIEKNPKSPRYLKTVRSVGYMLVLTNDFNIPKLHFIYPPF